MVHWWWFLWVITIFSFSLPTLSFPPMGVRHELPRNWWFLPNGDFMVSWCIGSRVDLVSSWRNNFYDFCSLSSLITLPYQHFAYVASHLMRIETIINTPLGLPLPNLFTGKALFSVHACKTDSLFRLSYLTDPFLSKKSYLTDPSPFVACMQKKIDDEFNKRRVMAPPARKREVD